MIEVLVYGSLKHSCHNHDVMQSIGAEYLGYDSITGDFEMVSLGTFPGVHQNPNRLTIILGELYTVNEAGLAALDYMEGHPEFYKRLKFCTDLMGHDAWLYILPKQGGYLDTEYDTLTSVYIWKPTEDEKNFWKRYGI